MSQSNASPAQGKRPRQLAPRHGTARLTLHINGSPYRVKPLPVEDEDTYKLFELKFESGKVYHVAQTSDGHTCNCPDFVFHRDGLDPRGCKHVLGLKATGLMEEV